MWSQNKLWYALKPNSAADSMLERISETLGVAGLVIFALFSLLSIAGANLGLALMLIAFLLSANAWKQMTTEPLFWASALAIGYITLRTYLALSEYEAYPNVQVNQAKDWALLFLYFIPAWWISRSPDRGVITLALMLTGFSLGILTSLDSATLERISAGGRSGLHFGKPIIFGFVCAVAILALSALMASLLAPQSNLSKPRKRLFIGLTLIAILGFLQGLAISQSRGVWLALLVSLPISLLLLWRTGEKGQRPTRSMAALTVSLVALALMTLALNSNIISKRLTVGREAMALAVTDGLEQAPLTSATYRLHLWQFGLEKWLERPLLGWGPGTTQSLVAARNSVALKHPIDNRSYDHLHNAYLELLLQLGAVGFLLVSLNAYMIVVVCIRGYRSGRISRYMLAFLIGNFTLIAAYSLTDFRHLHWNWRFCWMILGGVAFGMSLLHRDRVADGEPHSR
jgi:O-antigen ligase